MSPLSASVLAILKERVISSAVALSRVAAEFDGDLTVCGEHLNALWTACDNLEAELVRQFNADARRSALEQAS